MIIKKFTYNNSNKTSELEVLILHKNVNDKYFDGIDLTKLNENEKENLIKLQKNYETKLKQYSSKAFRRFLIENTLNVKEEIWTQSIKL